MANLTPTEAAELQAERLTQSLDRIRRGVDKVDVAPGQKAAAKKDKLRRNWLAAIDDGTWEKAVSGVTLEDWKTAMKEKGVQRIPDGIAAAKGKQIRFYESLFAFQDGLQREIESMPDVTLEDGVNRAAAWIRGMAKYRKPTT